MIYIEWVAAIATFLCVLLTMKRHVFSWPTGLIAVGLYAVIFFHVKLYADFGLQFLFFAQGIWGWWLWHNNHETCNVNKVDVERMTFEQKAYTVAALIVMVQVIASLLIDLTDDPTPWADSAVASLSIVATYWQGKRKIESWWLWILVDVISWVLYGYKGLYLSSCLYLILYVLAVRGLEEWSDHLNEEEEALKDIYYPNEMK